MRRDIVRSPGAVGVVALERVGARVDVVLVRQYRAAFDEEVLEIPAGMRDVAGEAPEVTAARELAEEAGLEAEHLEHLHTFYPSVGMTDATVQIYVAYGLRDVGRRAQGPEETHMRVMQVPLAEAEQMVTDGRIRDAKTVIGILLAVRQLGTGTLGV